MLTSALAVGDDVAEPPVGNYFVAVYPPFACWNREDLRAVHRQLAQSPPAADSPPLGLYVHVPFCIERCDYCYYRAYAGESRHTRDRYVDALLAELALYRSFPALSGRSVDFVYFGGGTPSLLPVGQIERLMRGCQAIFPWTAAREISFECAPKSATRSRLAALRDAGITRISLGLQQLDDEVLRQNGRVHRTRDAERAYDEIARAGFSTVNVDLMAGLVGESDASFQASLERVIEWRPDSVTLYQLEIPRNTPLYRALREERVTAPAGWDIKRRRVIEAWDRLASAGYTLRSAYAAVRDPAKDRFLYQDEQYRGADLLGTGVASFSYLRGVHFQNCASLNDYLASVTAGQLPLARAHALSDEERLVREFILQLKLGRVENQHFRDKFSVDVDERFAGPLVGLRGRGWIRRSADAWTLTRAGLARVDRLLAEFYLPEHQPLAYW